MYFGYSVNTIKEIDPVFFILIPPVLIVVQYFCDEILVSIILLQIEYSFEFS
jgi:hypothetical protein